MRSARWIRMLTSGIVLFVFAVIPQGEVHAQEAAHETARVEKYLVEGSLAEGERLLLADLARNERADGTRFELGVLQLVRAFERFGQTLYRFGPRQVNAGFLVPIPVVVPPNPDPEEVTPQKFRKLLSQFLADLDAAERTLAAIRDPDVRLPLRVGLVRVDFKQDGKSTESLKAFLTRLRGGPAVMPKNDEWRIVFDRGDVAWMRGYCHLLMAAGEAILAHDLHEIFDRTGHLFFAKVSSKHPFVQEYTVTQEGVWQWRWEQIMDCIAYIHLLRLDVTEPDRLRRALTHMEEVLALSRETWRFITAETDDDHEWLPNPKQKGVLGVPISQAMVDGWHEFLDEAEALLAGKRLVPFWRGTKPRGLNLRRVFTEPRPFDFVLWVQGTAATPYLEEGPMTRPDVWMRLQRLFQGEFVGFALWFN